VRRRRFFASEALHSAAAGPLTSSLCSSSPGAVAGQNRRIGVSDSVSEVEIKRLLESGAWEVCRHHRPAAGGQYLPPGPAMR
jgi:hypothetical protein